MDHATVVVSGTKIADEIGTGRSEVWRLVQQLRTLGVEIAGHPATGYQLKSMPDLLLPDMLAPAAEGHDFRRKHIHHYYKIGSTNTAAMEARSARARPRAACFSPSSKLPAAAAARIMGLGAFGRNLLLGGAAARAAAVGSAGAFPGRGAGGARRVQEIDPNLADLKWPNDVLSTARSFAAF